MIEAYKTGNTDKLNAKDLFVYDKLMEVIGEVITDDMTDYEKEKAIYDWQVKWISYNNDNLNPITDGQSETHTPYGVFRTHNAICVGNTTTFKLVYGCAGDSMQDHSLDSRTANMRGMSRSWTETGIMWM